MYDTIGFWFEDIDNKSSYLKKDIVDRETGKINYSGKLDNFTIYTKFGKSYVRGSLSKFYLGNNVETLTQETTRLAIEKLSDLLGINPDLAWLSRIDISINLRMNLPIMYYTSCLGDMSRHKKWIIDNYSTVMFKNDLREICFYDKTKELIDKKIYFPKLSKNDYILRYELRLRKRVNQQLNLPEIKLSSLYNEDFCHDLIQKLAEYYSSINKTKNIIVKDERMFDSHKKLMNVLAAIGLQEIGGESFLVNQLNQQEMYKMKRSRLEQTIKKLATNEDFTMQNEAISELDQKMIENLDNLLILYCSPTYSGHHFTIV
jgi:hypothetical protein